jgi:hypothetical protein
MVASSLLLHPNVNRMVSTVSTSPTTSSASASFHPPPNKLLQAVNEHAEKVVNEKFPSYGML